MPWWRFNWNPWGRYTTWGAKREGKRDGLAGIPHWDAPSAQYALELKQAADYHIREVVEQWQKKDEPLAEKQVEAEQFRDRINDETVKAEKILNTLEEEYKNTFGNPLPEIGFGHFLGYWLFLFIIGICELPLNAVAFRIMGESEIFTYIVTGGLAVGIPYFAHLTGAFFKEASKDRSKLYWALACVGFVVMVVVGVAYIRQQYIARFTEEQGMAKVAWLFVLINFFLFAVASIASYRLHNPLLFEVLRARKRYRKLRKTLERAAGEVEAIKERRKKILTIYYSIAQSYKDSAQALMQIYYQYNLRHRSENARGSTPQPAWTLKANQPQITINFQSAQPLIQQLFGQGQPGQGPSQSGQAPSQPKEGDDQNE